MASSLNIYFLDPSPAVAARSLADGHVVSAREHATTVLRDAAAMRLAVHEGRPLRRDEAAHPRHPITRAGARSTLYTCWIYSYGKVAASEARYRELSLDLLGEIDLDKAAGEVLSQDPVDPVRRSVLPSDFAPPADPSRLLAAVPQRLDGCADLAVPGDPVASYRRYYAAAKVPGGARTWAGTNASWTRRAPPGWLAEHGVRVQDLTAVGDPHPVWGAFAS